MGLRLQNQDVQTLRDENIKLRKENLSFETRRIETERRFEEERIDFERQLEELRIREHHPILLRIAKTVTCSVCGVLSGYPEIPNEYPEEGIEYVRLTCKGGHGICVECLTAMVRASTNNADVSVTCVCEGCGQDFDEDVITKCDRDVYREYIQAKAVFEHEERMKKENTQVQNTNIANVAIVKTPCCDRDVCDFQDCCKVNCDFCKTSWCAWCFKVQGTMTVQEFYAHVHDCPFNPDKGAIYPTERGKQVMTQFWIARQAQQIKKVSDFELAKPRG
jgi:hypothetical protein